MQNSKRTNMLPIVANYLQVAKDGRVRVVATSLDMKRPPKPPEDKTFEPDETTPLEPIKSDRVSDSWWLMTVNCNAGAAQVLVRASYCGAMHMAREAFWGDDLPGENLQVTNIAQIPDDSVLLTDGIGINALVETKMGPEEDVAEVALGESTVSISRTTFGLKFTLLENGTRLDVCQIDLYDESTLCVRLQHPSSQQFDPSPVVVFYDRPGSDSRADYPMALYLQDVCRQSSTANSPLEEGCFVVQPRPYAFTLGKKLGDRDPKGLLTKTITLTTHCSCLLRYSVVQSLRKAKGERMVLELTRVRDLTELERLLLPETIRKMSRDELRENQLDAWISMEQQLEGWAETLDHKLWEKPTDATCSSREAQAQAQDAS